MLRIMAQKWELLDNYLKEGPTKAVVNTISLWENIGSI